jgi:hypothetical protein
MDEGKINEKRKLLRSIIEIFENSGSLANSPLFLLAVVQTVGSDTNLMASQTMGTHDPNRPYRLPETDMNDEMTGEELRPGSLNIESRGIGQSRFFAELNQAIQRRRRA